MGLILKQIYLNPDNHIPIRFNDVLTPCVIVKGVVVVTTTPITTKPLFIDVKPLDPFILSYYGKVPHIRCLRTLCTKNRYANINITLIQPCWVYIPICFVKHNELLYR